MSDVLLPEMFNSSTYSAMNWEEALVGVVWFLRLDKNASHVADRHV